MKHFFTLCTLLLMNSVLRSQVLTPRMIFDFNPGDVFHYSQSGYSTSSYSGGFSHYILNKYVSATNDTIKYTIKKASYSIITVPATGNKDTVFKESYDTLTYTSLDTAIQYLVAYNIASYYRFKSYYNLYAQIDSSCLDALTFTDTLSEWPLADSILSVHYNGIYINLNTCDNSTRTYSSRFSTGLGNIQQSEMVSGGPYYGNSYSLVYFKKGDIRVGLPDILLNTRHEIAKKTVELFPNPARKFLHIQASDELVNSMYYVLDFSGQMILSGKIHELLTTIDVQNLSEGIYTLIIDGLTAKKFIR